MKKTATTAKIRMDLVKTVTSMAKAQARRSRVPTLGTVQLDPDRQALRFSDLDGMSIEVLVPGLTAPQALNVLHTELAAALASNGKALTFDVAAFALNRVRLDPTRCTDAALSSPAFDMLQAASKLEPGLVVPLPAVAFDISRVAPDLDVRFYLKGVCFDLDNHAIVATDGHRMHLANSATLPTFTREQLSLIALPTFKPEKMPLSVDSAIKPIFSTPALALMEKFGFTEFNLVRLPVINGKPDDGTPELLVKFAGRYLVRASNEFGSISFVTVEGVFPDWQRVCPTVNELQNHAASLMAYGMLSEEDIKTKNKASDDRISELLSISMLELNHEQRAELRKLRDDKLKAPEWRVNYPVKVTIPAAAANEIRKFVKARKALESSKYVPLVSFDLNVGVLQGWESSGVELSIPIQVGKKPNYDINCEEHMVGVSAEYLADALDYIGDADWYISKKDKLVSHKGDKSAVVMPRNL